KEEPAMRRRWTSCIATALLAAACATPRGSRAPQIIFDPLPPPPIDSYLVLRNAAVYDGSGGAPITADVGIRGDRIAAVGDLHAASATQTIDGAGLAVAPGFVNMLSWATDSLIADPRGMSDLVQGVTLEVMGEGWSMGPLNEAMKKEGAEQQGDIRYPITWTTLGEY